MLRRLSLILFAILVINVLPVHAHANLLRSEPPANTPLENSPDTLLLYFSEPLEASFSRIELRNAQGDVLNTSPAQLSDTDAKLLRLSLAVLPDGVYTVSWRAVSQTDGHMTQGSYPLIIGAASANNSAINPVVKDDIPLISSLIRWFNLLSLAWMVGSIAFCSFVWQAHLSDQYTKLENRMRRMIGYGWLCVGIATGLILWLQAQIVSGADWIEALRIVPQVLLTTRFGNLWLTRALLWGIFGFLLWRQSQQQKLLVLIAIAILITQSLFSHASGAADALPSIVADSLHLLAMSLWIGGLIQLVIVIPSMRKQLSDLALLVARFSNMARLSVAILVITGVYAAWLHIGTFDALFSTHYGQAMLLKLILFSPLLLIGAVNLFLTQRGLNNGKAVWSKRLQYLVATEILLAIAIIGAVGVMTAIAPARITFAAREASPPPIESDPFFEMAFEDEMMIHFTIEPATLGENTFYVDLYDEETHTAITNASLIRLRFENETETLGESELRPQLVDGRYIISGANLSVAGEWQVRMTIQRPDEFDTVLDFAPTISLPEQPLMPDFDPTPSQDYRALALMLTGLAGFVAGSVFLFSQRPLRNNPQVIVTIIFIVASAYILLSGGQVLLPKNIAPPILENQPIQMSIAANSELPYLLTQDGAVLRPISDGWARLAIDGVRIQAIYLENDTLWAATDSGLYVFNGETWEQRDDLPSENLAITHGYVYAMGMGSILRIGQGSIENDVRELEIPDADAAAIDLVMLGNHSHILLNGADVFLTSSLGLGWQALDAPDDILAVSIDGDGNLLAATDTALLRWHWSDARWQTIRDLPPVNQVAEIIVLENQIFLLADYRLYQFGREAWLLVDLPEPILDLTLQYPDTLWALDSEQGLWKLAQAEWEHVTMLELDS